MGPGISPGPAVYFPLGVGARRAVGGGATSARVRGAAASAQATDNGAVAIVGYDGEAYLDRVGDRNEVRVDTPSGPCRVRFDAAQGPGIPRIGPLACLPERSP